MASEQQLQQAAFRILNEIVSGEPGRIGDLKEATGIIPRASNPIILQALSAGTADLGNLRQMQGLVQSGESTAMTMDQIRTARQGVRQAGVQATMGPLDDLRRSVENALKTIRGEKPPAGVPSQMVMGMSQPGQLKQYARELTGDLHSISQEQARLKKLIKKVSTIASKGRIPGLALMLLPVLFMALSKMGGNDAQRL